MSSISNLGGRESLEIAVIPRTYSSIIVDICGLVFLKQTGQIVAEFMSRPNEVGRTLMTAYEMKLQSRSKSLHQSFLNPIVHRLRSKKDESWLKLKLRIPAGNKL